ncbi:fungal-specific transcription factor domain-domain-containing protein [Clohesyomyces aquaticus]|uniref:Fungal-specific transcription factor domain-domain-containing protein n=1 Tax=Clohesyomyces aquaticus TaxID=1231657 RepID=A0A1Y1Y0W6_9PLEO|nr:fungal-specific transcription factor domain-domain-containing protein [Clohesyomyces aquaticus]
MARHRQKDEEVGAAGCGVLNTRKRMWKDADGNIVTKKPTLASSQHNHSPRGHRLDNHGPLDSSPDFIPFQDHHNGAPISPPISHDPSLGHASFDDHDGEIAGGYPSILNPHSLSTSESYSPPSDQRFWSPNLPQTEPFIPSTTAFNDAPFDDVFNSDTASSFNNPFTTLNNYNWLFDLDLSRQEPVVADPFPSFQFSSVAMNPPPDTFEIHLNQMISEPEPELEKTLANTAQHASIQSRRLDSPQEIDHSPMISPPIASPPLQTTQATALGALSASESQSQSQSKPQPTPPDCHLPSPPPFELEHPLSLLSPSHPLPTITPLARTRLLDLISLTAPVSADGSLVTRDDPLLSLSSLQTYSDLFFKRFNTAYPLIHMPTFDPPTVDPLLLVSAVLLGATYAEKGAHQLATFSSFCLQIPGFLDSMNSTYFYHPPPLSPTLTNPLQVCIHDVLRPQIFASTSFSAKPSLWVLQTILLVECFGKSRAGQKQHEMSHLFHGLLINLIRRSECQSIREKEDRRGQDRSRGDEVEDEEDGVLEDEWRKWVDGEQKKRLALLCFMWDVQHAVLFCQSLCMSAFELRSTLPCDQAPWEAKDAETWARIRQQPKYRQPLPTFLTCLKRYLSPCGGGGTGGMLLPGLNALSRSLLLHGLMSVAWDMQRRDQTSLGVLSPSSSPLQNWPPRLASSYTLWASDFCLHSTNYLSSLPPSHPLAIEFSTFRTATLALYHSAHILLYTPFLDLQIYAGARHILGRPVGRADYVRSQRGVKMWVSGSGTQDEGGGIKRVREAVWHAGKIVGQGVHILDNPNGDLEGGRLWNLPWCVYLGTLVIWGAWYARPLNPNPHITSFHEGEAEARIINEEEDEDEIIWDAQAEMRRLLEGIRRSGPDMDTDSLFEGVMKGAVGRKGTNGLAVVVSRCLSTVRWAVVHDGMMVVRGLVCWRLVAGGGGGMGT